MFFAKLFPERGIDLPKTNSHGTSRLAGVSQKRCRGRLPCYYRADPKNAHGRPEGNLQGWQSQFFSSCSKENCLSEVSSGKLLLSFRLSTWIFGERLQMRFRTGFDDCIRSVGEAIRCTCTPDVDHVDLVRGTGGSFERRKGLGAFISGFGLSDTTAARIGNTKNSTPLTRRC